mgnify:FL=1
MRILETKSDEEEYTRFLESNERCNFQQSLEWAKVKTSWKREVILAEDSSKKIIGSLMVWIRKIPIFGNIMYSARGPVCDIHNMEILKQLTEGAKLLAQKYNAIVLRIEPDIKSDDTSFRNIMLELGYSIKDDAKNFREEIQPRYVFRLDTKDKTEDEIFKNFHSKTRYNIRLATKKGVTIKDGTKEDLKDFHKIMVTTGIRDGFITRPLEYFERMYDCLGPEHMKILMAYYEGKPISGVIPIMYGNKTWYLYGASSNEHRNLMPNYLLQWEMIKIAISRKSDIYDLRGVPGIADNSNGLFRFKKGFGAEYTEFIGEVYIPFKPLTYKMYKISEKIFRNVRALKLKFKKK